MQSLAPIQDLDYVERLGVSRENASGAHDDEIVDERYVPLATTLDDELEEGGDEAMRELKKKQRELIDSLPLDQYEIEGDTPAWEEAEKQVLSATKQGKSNPVVSVKSAKQKRKAGGQTAAEVYEEAFGEKKKKSKRVKKSA
ncbi:UPF0202 protein C20G8.09c [Fusarium odoratissimum]|uniref:UPF0202 protein C20G8.09c n=1 Tax=Fusarium oxysporum f. sp. cubense (strain race 4) TaxID=2502994 RepID=N1R8H3_FUSC4|nr:UPF0202 protein C20G8.09c [Fusarium odoratissimum]